jgi:hypothetical protein
MAARAMFLIQSRDRPDRVAGVAGRRCPQADGAGSAEHNSAVGPLDMLTAFQRLRLALANRTRAKARVAAMIIACMMCSRRGLRLYRCTGGKTSLPSGELVQQMLALQYVSAGA